MRANSLSGQALVEFALASMLFFTIIFGTLDLGRVVYQYSMLQNSIRQGARYAKVDPTNTAEIVDRVQHGDGEDDENSIGSQPWPGLNLANMTVSVDPGGEDVGDTVSVTVTYQFELIVGEFLNLPDPTYEKIVQVEVE